MSFCIPGMSRIIFKGTNVLTYAAESDMREEIQFEIDNNICYIIYKKMEITEVDV